MAPKDTNYTVKDRVYLDGDGRPTKEARKGVKLYAIPGQEIPLAQAREVGLLGDKAAAEEADRKRREEEEATAAAEAAEAERLERERKEQEEREAEDARRTQEQSAQLSKDAAEKAEAERREAEAAEAAAASESTIDLTRANLATLQEEAKRLGVDTTGAKTKAQIRERIEAHNKGSE
jgi:hypothetical protein